MAECFLGILELAWLQRKARSGFFNWDIRLPGVLFRVFFAEMWGVATLTMGTENDPTLREKSMNREPTGGILDMENEAIDGTEAIQRAVLPAADAACPKALAQLQDEVLSWFEECRSPLLRYVLSFGLTVQDGEEVAQEVFLALFRHFQLQRSRENVRGWLFRVAHNLALKRREANQKSPVASAPEWAAAESKHDPDPNPEEQLEFKQRQQRLMAVLSVLPEEDQQCLRLRAEGLRYREIAAVLGISLGSVSSSLTRSLARLSRADGK